MRPSLCFGEPNSPLYGPAAPGLTYAQLFALVAFGPNDIGEYRVFTPLDMFRYSSAGLDLSVGADAFFPILAFVPEPTTWAMMILGLGVVGGVARRRRRVEGLAI